MAFDSKKEFKEFYLPATIKAMVEYAQSQGYQIAIDNVRRHHEIYLGDPRKTSTDKLKTVIRNPIR